MKLLFNWRLIPFLCLAVLNMEMLFAQEEQQIKDEIIAVERAFQQMTESWGIAHAFRYYAAQDAVLNRGSRLVEGKEAIFEFYNKPQYQKAAVNWSPSEVRVSKAGDMACSYGEYTWLSVDDNGDEQESKGIYMTIWQKQADGSWRYIWD